MHMTVFNSTTWQILAEQDQLIELTRGQFGLEIEAHRITNDGHFSRHPHPESIAPRAVHPYIQTDYSDTQSELVTEPAGSFTEARQRLAQLQWIFRRALQPNEAIWPLSMPPHLDDTDLNWLDTTFGRPWVQDYRDWLKLKYGPTHEVMTGPHINFSISANLIDALFAAATETDKVAFTNALYFRFAQNFAAHRWLFIYLFGAAPFNFNTTDSRIPNDLPQPVRSIRDSEYGFTNDPDIHLDYDVDLAHSIAVMKQYIKAGQLFSPHEFYGTVRFKGYENEDKLLTNGVKYLELRVLDTDPFNPMGIPRDGLNTIQLLLMQFIVSDRQYTPAELHHYDALAKAVALQHPREPLPAELLGEALTLLEDLREIDGYFNLNHAGDLEVMEDRLLNPSHTLANRLISVAPTAEALHQWAIDQATIRQADFHKATLLDANSLFAAAPLRDLHIAALVHGAKVLSAKDDELILSVGDHREVITTKQELFDLFPELKQD